MELALFDFDGTLTDRDTLLPFLRQLAGRRDYWLGMARMSPALLGYAGGLIPNHIAKERLLQHFLAPRPASEIEAVAARFASEAVPRWLRPGVLAKLREHQKAGHICLLVSASPELYLNHVARDLGFAALLCTRLEKQDERYSGRLLGANCHGPEKVRRIESWLSGRQPGLIHAYGDSSGDREMLAMAQHAHYRPR
ncbi:HAD family hydrolase [Chitinimonas lacunae]|uniref:HAD family hydrolase n=1 Tax=Chitinimonas lacunae TaxID=1963018 RepID=A0ABV8MYF7_9NEIS